jgi:hypothetical protein
MSRSGDFGEAMNRILKTGKNINEDGARALVRKYGAKAILDGIDLAGNINPQSLKGINKLLTDPSALLRLRSQQDIIIKNLIDEATQGGKIDALFKKDGTLVRGDYTYDELSRITNKSADDIADMANNPNVKNVAESRKSDLVKLGISGSMVAGLIFIMIITGKSNPVEAIAEALKAAAKTAADTGSDIFKELFSGMGGFFNVSASFSFCSSILLILYLVGSAFLKK